MKPKVYFTKTVTPEKVIEMYKQLDCKLPGNVAIKVHSGEFGNKNFLRPEFWRPVVEEVGGTIVECNTAYGGSRATTKDHCVTLEKHGWSHLSLIHILTLPTNREV